MDTYGVLFGGLLFPAWEGLVRNRPTLGRLAFLEAMQWRSRDEVRAYQLAQLRRLLTHAGERIPYYRALFSRIGFDPRGLSSLSEYQQLPLLTRDILVDRYDELVDAGSASSHIRKQTSGSTGHPVSFEYDRGSEVWRQATKLLGYGWGGFRPGVRTLHYWGAPNMGTKAWTRAKISVDRFLRRERYVDCLHQDPRHLGRAVQAIRRFRPDVIVGYTMATATLARHVLDTRAELPAPIDVLVGAEALLEGDRVCIEQAFGGKVFETYGSRETMLMASECNAHDGLHTMDASHLIELRTPDGSASPGESGEVVVTDLHNYGMPLIRYLNGDLAVAAKGECVCGRGFGRLGAVAGRRVEALRSATGDLVPGLLISALFAGLRHQVREFQIVQRPDNSLDIRVIPCAKFQEASLKPLVSEVRRYLRGVAVRVEPVSRIDRTSSGKHRPVVVEPPATGV